MLNTEAPEIFVPCIKFHSSIVITRVSAESMPLELSVFAGP